MRKGNDSKIILDEKVHFYYGTFCLKLERLWYKKGLDIEFNIFSSGSLLILFFLFFYFFFEITFAITIHHGLITVNAQIFGNIGAVDKEVSLYDTATECLKEDGD